jgi:hypothetical protein
VMHHSSINETKIIFLFKKTRHHFSIHFLVKILLPLAFKKKKKKRRKLIPNTLCLHILAWPLCYALTVLELTYLKAATHMHVTDIEFSM